MSLQQVGSAFLRIILFMVGWAAILVAMLALGHSLGRTDDQLLVPLLVLIALILLTFFPYLNAVAQRVFAVPGEGPPVPPAELHRRLEELNTFDAPVMAHPKRWGYLFTWRYVDAKWWELFAQAGLTETYELRVKLDAAHHVATLTEVKRAVTWGAGVEEVRFGWSGFRGVVSEWERGVAWGIRETFAPGKLYDYTFTPSVVKNPVINTLVRSGWDVRFAIF